MKEKKKVTTRKRRKVPPKKASIWGYVIKYPRIIKDRVLDLIKFIEENI